jgi:diguanylate cyclase (GGDEF)-like protein
MGRRRQVESAPDRRARARALAGFFAAGAVLSTLVLVLPGWEEMHTAGILTTVVLAAMGAVTLAAFGERFGPGPTHAVTATGTLLIGACQVLAGGGSPTAMYAMLYIWVVLHASLFFSRAAVAGHLVLTTLVHALALVWLDDLGTVAPQLALTLGTQVAAAIVVTSLAATQRRLAETDSLTGLGNRRVVERALEWSISRSRRAPGSPTFVAVLDLDGFKAFNDRRGHVAGDNVLIETAAAWERLLRPTETLARTGGDEFMLVLAGCRREDAERVLHRMVAATAGDLRCSAGLARWDGTESATALTERADRALYIAKAGGPIALAPETSREAAGSPG